MVDMRGDQGSIEHTGGGAMFSVGTDAKKMKVTNLPEANPHLEGKYRKF